MTASTEEREFVAYVLELMQPAVTASAKRMFGGHGIFSDGLMFALVADCTLYFKVDSESQDAFDARGLERFTYHKQGREFSMSYCRAPEEALEDSDEMCRWTRLACTAAVRAAARKRSKKKGG